MSSSIPLPLLVLPERVATLLASSDKVTGRPELEEADTTTLLSWLMERRFVIGAKVITWVALLMVRRFVTVPE